MGVMFNLRCDRCENEHNIGVGFGMRSGVKHYYCAECGRMEERWFDVPGAESPVPAPRCPDHSKNRMRVVRFESEFDEQSGERVRTGIPCGACTNGHLFGYQSGLWD